MCIYTRICNYTISYVCMSHLYVYVRTSSMIISCYGARLVPTVFFKMPGSPVRRRDNESASTTWWWPGRPAPQRWSRRLRPTMTTTRWLRGDYEVTRLVWLVISCHILAQKWIKSPQKDWQFAAAPVPVLQLWFLTSDSRTANTSSTL